MKLCLHQIAPMHVLRSIIGLQELKTSIAESLALQAGIMLPATKPRDHTIA